jgi:TPR repeat protein
VRVAIVVIDACRDNPFAQGGTRAFGDSTRGLSRPPDQQPQGVFGLYSAGFGERALDRLGDDDADPNSVFTRVLVPALETPGQSLLDIAYVVTDEVAKLAQTIEHEQNPAYYDQARARDIVLAALPQGAEASATETPPSGPTAPGSCAGAELHFEAAREIGRVEALEDHIRKFGACPYAALAQMLIDDFQGVAPAGSAGADATTETANGADAEAPAEASGEENVAAVAPGEDVEARASDEAETPAETETPAAECQRLVVDIPGDKIETGPALAACRAAVGHAPDDDALHFLLGRVLSATQDFTEAAKEFRIAADAGNARAQFNLGRMYFRGDGVGIDQAEAAKWFRLAADQGHAIAQFNLAIAHYQGAGVEQSFEEAVKWFAAAAEQGDAESQYNLALMYFGGAGIGKDDSAAAEWFRKAAEQDHPNANWALGGMYYTGGGGLAKDMSEAARYLMRALKLGSEEATRELLEKRAGGFTSALRKEIQKILTGEGVYSGAIDGSFGPGTQAALQQYAGGG